MPIDNRIIQLKQDFDEVFEAGKVKGKEEYSEAWWDRYLKYANLNSNTLFSGSGWDKNTLMPRNRTIKPKQAPAMFQNFLALSGYGDAFDLVEHLKELNTIIDFSECTSMNNLFNWACFTRIGVIDFSSTNASSSAFANSKIGIIDKIIVHENLSFSSTFLNLSATTHMIVEGVIGKNGFDVQWMTNLDKESLTSIINCLSDNTSGLAVTLSLDAVNSAFETSQGANDGSASQEWAELTGRKTNWSISLK